MSAPIRTVKGFTPNRPTSAATPRFVIGLSFRYSGHGLSSLPKLFHDCGREERLATLGSKHSVKIFQQEQAVIAFLLGHHRRALGQQRGL